MKSFRAIFVWTWKMVSASVRYLFCQPMNEKKKHGLFVFPPKKTLIWSGHCLIGQSCCSMTSKRSIDWFLEISLGMKFFQPSVRLTIQKPSAFVFALFSFVCCFCFVHAFSSQSHTKLALPFQFANFQEFPGPVTFEKFQDLYELSGPLNRII